MVEDSSEIAALFAAGLEKINVQLADERVACLIRYYQQLLVWSKKINLIGKKQSPSQIVENHFLDSLLLLHAMDTADTGNVSLADIGTGAGFPGLVCKVARPEIELLLVEPRLKRVSFLRHMVRQLKLSGVSIEACRVEEVKNLASFSYLTSRAVAEIDLFIKMVGPSAHRKNSILCMKGPRWQQELDGAEKTLSKHHIALANVLEYNLPFSGAKRAILVFHCDRGVDGK